MTDFQTKDLMKQAEGYVLRYGGMCRDCADENGTCPQSGIVCDVEQRRKMVRHALEALEYGSKHGFIKLPFSALAAAYEQGKRDEREACALAVMEFYNSLNDPEWWVEGLFEKLSAAIRKRREA